MVVTASEDHTARLWSAPDGGLLSTLRHNNEVTHAVFSPDGRMVITASADDTARLWSAADGRLLRVLPGVAQFSPDGRMVLSISKDNTARVWRCRVCDPPEDLIKAIETRLGVPHGENLENVKWGGRQQVLTAKP
jgi:WD40 repeat protein